MRYFTAALIIIPLAFLTYLFGPIIKQEVVYRMDESVGIRYSVDTMETWGSERRVTPVNSNFAIVVPKINANAPIVDNVDPANPEEYIRALKGGVARATGTAYPGEVGNMFLFAHSTDAFYNVGRYNAVFFLIGHLNSGDEIDIFYRSRHYKYIVYDKRIVEATDTQYLGTLEEGAATLTLMTCYPPGTTFRRLVVLAKLQESSQ